MTAMAVGVEELVLVHGCGWSMTYTYLSLLDL